MSDDRYGYPGQFSLFKCRSCESMTVYPKLSKDEIGEIYSKYYPRKNFSPEAIRNAVDSDLRRYSWLTRWIKGTNNQGQFSAKISELVLDIGPGFCESLIYLKERGIRANGLEADPNVNSISHFFDLEVYIEPMSKFINRGNKYDLIILNQVIEHIIDPVDFVANLTGLLNKDGRILISCPNVNSIYRKIFSKSWINWHIPYHQHHFSKLGLKKLFLKSNMMATYSKTVTPNLWFYLQLKSASVYIFGGDTKLVWSASARDSNNQLSFFRRAIRCVVDSIFQILIVIICRSVDLLGMGDSLYVEFRRRW